jgi:hypothetical protein
LNSVALGGVVRGATNGRQHAGTETPAAAVDAVGVEPGLDDAFGANAPTGHELLPPARDAEFVAKLALHWQSENQLGFDILLDRTAAMRVCKLGGPGAPWDVSLLAYDVPDRSGSGVVYKKVSLFQWVCPETLTGRPVELDNVQRAKWPVAAHVPRMDLRGRNMKVVHPAIGFKMHLKGPRRKPPDTMLRLLTMWEAAEAATSRTADSVKDESIESDTLEQCAWCDNEVGVRLHTCSLCQLAWHSDCCRVFVTQCSASGIEGTDIRRVPIEFAPGLCLACRGLSCGQFAGRVGSSGSSGSSSDRPIVSLP